MRADLEPRAPAVPTRPPSGAGLNPDATSVTADNESESGSPPWLYPPVWAIARITLVIALTLAALVALWKVQEVLVLFVLAVLLATAIEPVVNRLRRGPFSRGQGILIVYTIIFGILVGIGFLFIPGLIVQASQFAEELPNRIAGLRPLFEQIGFTPLRAVLLRAISEVAPALSSQTEITTVAPPERLVEAGGIFAHSFFSVVTVFLLAYYWLTERATIKRAVLRLAPDHHARQVNATWLRVEEKLGAWVRGQILIMLVLGTMAGIAFLALGLPNALLLATLAGLFEIVPLVGPFLAFLPALLVALALDPFKALVLVPIAIVIQQIEGNVLVPRIMSRTVGVSPLTVILGILIGSILYGAAGAFLAVPIAATIQVILNDTLRPALEEPTPEVPVPESELEGDTQAPASVARPTRA